MKRKNLGVVQVPLLIGILIMAIALPIASKLVKQRQETRRGAAGSAPACPSGTVSERTYGECCACRKSKEVRECTYSDGRKDWFSSDCVHDSAGCTGGCEAGPTNTPSGQEPPCSNPCAGTGTNRCPGNYSCLAPGDCRYCQSSGLWTDNLPDPSQCPDGCRGAGPTNTPAAGNLCSSYGAGAYCEVDGRPCDPGYRPVDEMNDCDRLSPPKVCCAPNTSPTPIPQCSAFSTSAVCESPCRSGYQSVSAALGKTVITSCDGLSPPKVCCVPILPTITPINTATPRPCDKTTGRPNGCPCDNDAKCASYYCNPQDWECGPEPTLQPTRTPTPRPCNNHAGCPSDMKCSPDHKCVPLVSSCDPGDECGPGYSPTTFCFGKTRYGRCDDRYTSLAGIVIVNENGECCRRASLTPTSTQRQCSSYGAGAYCEVDGRPCDPGYRPVDEMNDCDRLSPPKVCCAPNTSPTPIPQCSAFSTSAVCESPCRSGYQSVSAALGKTVITSCDGLSPPKVCCVPILPTITPTPTSTQRQCSSYGAGAYCEVDGRPCDPGYRPVDEMNDCDRLSPPKVCCAPNTSPTPIPQCSAFSTSAVCESPCRSGYQSVSAALGKTVITSCDGLSPPKVCCVPILPTITPTGPTNTVRPGAPTNTPVAPTNTQAPGAPTATRTVTPTPQYILNIDWPQEGISLGGTTVVSGWAAERFVGPLTKVEFYMDLPKCNTGQTTGCVGKYGETPVNVSRPDLTVDGGKYLNAGYKWNLDTRPLNPGAHTINAYGLKGTSYVIGPISRRFVVAGNEIPLVCPENTNLSALTVSAAGVVSYSFDYDIKNANITDTRFRYGGNCWARKKVSGTWQAWTGIGPIPTTGPRPTTKQTKTCSYTIPAEDRDKEWEFGGGISVWYDMDGSGWNVTEADMPTKKTCSVSGSTGCSCVAEKRSYPLTGPTNTPTPTATVVPGAPTNTPTPTPNPLTCPTYDNLSALTVSAAGVVSYSFDYDIKNANITDTRFRYGGNCWARKKVSGTWQAWTGIGPIPTTGPRPTTKQTKTCSYTIPAEDRDKEWEFGGGISVWYDMDGSGWNVTEADMPTKKTCNASGPTNCTCPAYKLSYPVVSGPDAYLSFQMSYFGIVSDPKCSNTWKLKVMVKKGDLTKTYDNVVPVRDTTVSDKAVYKIQGLRLVGFPETQDVAVFIKGMPKHLQIKYAVADQEGFYNLAGGELDLTTNAATTPMYDFTAYPLLSGDVVGGANESQDGKIDGRDFAKVKALALERKSGNEGTDVEGDLDGSCVTTGNDWGVLLHSLNEIYEQLY